MSGTMIGSFSLIDIAILVGLWFVTSMLANLLWTRFVVLRYVGRAFMSWLDNVEKDKEGQRVLGKLFMYMFEWVGSAEIKTGEKVKVATDQVDEDGKPIYKTIDEVLTPVDMLARVIGNYALMKIKGSAGGTRAQLGRILSEEAANLGGLSPTAAKELNKGRYGPAIIEMLAPAVQQRLNKVKGDTSSSVGDSAGRY